MNPDNPLRTARVMEFFISPTQVTFKFDGRTNPEFFSNQEKFTQAIQEYIDTYPRATGYSAKSEGGIITLIVYGIVNMNAAVQFM